MFNGLNNKLANVPTITGLSDIVADTVNTDTLIVDGNDVSSIIDQVPINTAAIAALQQVTTGQSYATIGDTTTFDNNVTLGAGKTMTADNFTGLASNASQVLVTLNDTATTYYPTFTTAGTGQKSLLLDSTTTPLSYTPDTSTLSASNFSGLASTASQVLVTVNNDNVPYYLTFATAVTSQKSLLMDTTTTALSYVPFTSTLSATNFTAGTNVTTPNILSLTSITPSNSRSILLNGTPIGNAGNTSTVCMGTNAGAVGTSPNNCFCFGTNAGASLTTGIPFSGVQNLFIGANSGSSVTSGRNNTFLGGSAGRKTISGQYNTQIGAQSQDFPDENFVGSYNTTIGAECHILNDGLTHTTAIGAKVVATTSNTVQIGRVTDNTVFDGTVTMKNTATLTTGSLPTSPSFSVIDSVTSNRIAFIPNAGTSAFNTLVANGDSVIYASSAAVDTADLSIVPHSNTTCGIRLTPTKATIGAGGTGAPTAAVECSGTNVNVIAGTFSLNGTTFPAFSNIVTTDTAQTITGLKNFEGLVEFSGAGALNASNVTHQFTSATNYKITHNVNSGTMEFWLPTSAGVSSKLMTLQYPATNIGFQYLYGYNIYSGFTGVTYVGNSSSTEFIIDNQSTSGIIRILCEDAGGISQPVLTLSTAAVTFHNDNILLEAGAFNLGNGAGTASNLICGNTNAKSVVFTNGNNTVIGTSAGNTMNVASDNNTLVGNSAGSRITTSVQNVCVGSSSGTGITTGTANTFVGYLSGFQAPTNATGGDNVCVGRQAGTAMTTTANGNVMVGSLAGWKVTTGVRNMLLGGLAGEALISGNDNVMVGNGAGTALLTGLRNTFIGAGSGDTVTGNDNIVIGAAADVPVPAGSNQIILGRNTERLMIQGQLNYRVGQITNSTNGNISAVALAQIYMVAMSAAGQTITLPNPAAAVSIGAMVMFKRKTNTTAFTLTSTAAGFLNYGAITIAASPYTVPSTIFQVDLVSDGTNWCVVAQR